MSHERGRSLPGGVGAANSRILPAEGLPPEGTAMTVRADPGRQSLHLLAAALLAAAGCKAGPAPPAEKTEILIGATLPLTGAEARLGGFYKEGYELAFAEVKKRGGLDVGGKKLPVNLKLLDDTTNQATAVSLADQLINRDGVDFLLGTYSTHLVQAQTTVAEQNRVPYVNGGGAASEIYRRGYKYIFGALAPVELLGATLMMYIDEQRKAGKLPTPSRIAVVWENTLSNPLISCPSPCPSPCPIRLPVEPSAPAWQQCGAGARDPLRTWRHRRAEVAWQRPGQRRTRSPTAAW